MRKPSPRQAILALLLVGAVAFLLVSLRAGQPAKRAAGARKPRAAAAKSAVKLRAAAPADVDFRRYASLASSDIFSENRGVPRPATSTPTKVMRPPTFPTGPIAPLVPRVDLSGWSYVGYVTLDGEKLGAIQNDASSTVNFLAVGDSFMGAEVESFDRESMRLKAGTSVTTLSRPRDFPIKPLEQAPGPGQQPPKGPGGPS